MATWRYPRPICHWYEMRFTQIQSPALRLANYVSAIYSSHNYGLVWCANWKQSRSTVSWGSLYGIYGATLVSQLQHASPAWSWFLSASECSRLRATINKAVRYGFLPTHTPSLTDLFQTQSASSFNQSSAIHTMLFINYSHLWKTLVIHYDINTYCQPYPSPSHKRVSLTECYIYLHLLNYTILCFVFLYCVYMYNSTC